MQKPFSTLSEQGQVRRMSCLARKALEAYPVNVARVSPLKQVYNKNFRITAQGGEQYMLRICHPRRTSVEPVQSELLWLAALNRETNLRVPEPVLNKERQYVTVVDSADVPGIYLSVLFHWTDGRFLYRTLTPSHLFEVGGLTAHLHHHSTNWDRPAGFIRRRVDNLFCLRQEQDDNLNEAVAAQAVQAVADVSAHKDAMLVETVIRKVWAVLQGLGEEPENFGLIHADVHQSNLLFNKGQVGLIDFDDCGFGHWLYDLAVTLYCLHDHPKYTNLRQAFLAGYRKSHPLSMEREGYLETFMALRTLQDMLWDIEERDQPAFRERWHAEMMSQLHRLREFASQ
jgi:Ser/Thr protein kinase RdoA (MazF antagonist)